MNRTFSPLNEIITDDNYGEYDTLAFANEYAEAIKHFLETLLGEDISENEFDTLYYTFIDFHQGHLAINWGKYKGCTFKQAIEYELPELILKLKYIRKHGGDNYINFISYLEYHNVYKNVYKK